MLPATHTDETPWRVVLANDKLRARLEIIRSVLAAANYDGKDEAAVGEVDARLVMAPARYLKQHADS